MNNPGSIQRPYSPTLSDGSKPKRAPPSTTMDEELSNTEKFQKVRKLSPVASPGGSISNIAQSPSPSYVSVSITNKTSPKGEKQPKRSVSPKALYPPSIQKYLNGKSQQSIEETVEKLKLPSNKTFKNHLEKMKLLGRVQEQEVESNIIFRKAYTNSPTSVSPAHSGSPLDSPRMMLSPQHPGGKNYQSDDIVMTFDDDTTMQSSPPPSGMEGSLTGANIFNQNRSNMLGQQNYGGFPMGQQQHFGNASYMGQGNHNLTNYSNQGNQYNQPNPNFASYQGGQFGNQQAYYNNQYSNHQSNQGPQSNIKVQDQPEEEEESRDRTTSFLQGAGFPSDFASLGLLAQGSKTPKKNKKDIKSLAANQVNAVQSIVQIKKTVSPGEPSQGLMQYMQKRNSNPDNLRMPPPQNYNNNYNPNMQQMSQYNNNHNQQGNYMYQQGNMGGNYPQQNQYNQQVNPQDLERKLEETSTDTPNYLGERTGFGQGEMVRHHSEGKAPYSNMSIYNQYHSQGNLYGNTGEMNHEWNMEHNFDINNQERGPEAHNMLEPELFFSLGRNESGDFDMNIIPSDLNFMPRQQSDQMDDKLVVPDPTGLDALLNDPHNAFKFNS